MLSLPVQSDTHFQGTSQPNCFHSQKLTPEIHIAFLLIPSISHLYFCLHTTPLPLFLTLKFKTTDCIKLCMVTHSGSLSTKEKYQPLEVCLSFLLSLQAFRVKVLWNWQTLCYHWVPYLCLCLAPEMYFRCSVCDDLTPSSAMWLTKAEYWWFFSSAIYTDVKQGSSII